MKRVYEASDPVQAHLLKELLADNDIEASIEGERLFAIRGGTPVVYPSVLVREQDEENARVYVATFVENLKAASSQARQDRTCPGCGEKLAAQYTECWRCNATLTDEQRIDAQSEDSVDEFDLEPAPAKSAGRPCNAISFLILLAVVVLAFILGASVVYKRSAATHEAHLGYVAYQKEDYAAAIAHYNEAIRLHPDFEYYLHLRGLAYNKNKDYDNAIADLTRAIELNSTRSSNYATRAAAYRGKNDLEKALADYNMDVKLNFSESPGYSNRGWVYWLLGDLGKARDDAEYALNLNPKSVAAHDLRGIVFADKGDYASAIGEYGVALAIRKDAIVYVHRSQACFHAGKLDEALMDATHALEFDSKSIAALSFRGFLLSKANERQRAHAEYLKATELSARVPHELGSRAYAWAAIGDFAHAFQDAEAFRNRQPWNRFAFNNLACIHCMRAVTRQEGAEGEKEKAQDIEAALQALEEGMKKGLRDWAPLKEQSDLKILLGNPRFEKLFLKP